MKLSFIVWRALLPIVFLMASLPNFASAQEAIPAFDVAKPAENQMLTLSPDGRHIAFVKSETDKFCFDGKGQMKAQGNEKCPERIKKFRSKHTLII